MFILKGFKCLVLEVRILKGLWACFSEVRNLKELAAGGWRLVGARKERADLNPKGAESPEGGRGRGKRSLRDGEEWVDKVRVERNMGNHGRVLANYKLFYRITVISF